MGPSATLRPPHPKISVLNTAAIKFKDKDWALTSLFDLREAGLLPGVRSNVEHTQSNIEERSVLQWNCNPQEETPVKKFTDVQSDMISAEQARNALDYIRNTQKKKENSDITDDAEELRNVIDSLVDWEPFYSNLDGTRMDDVEVIHILMFDKTFRLPCERREAMGDSRIKLTSAGHFDFPAPLRGRGGNNDSSASTDYYGQDFTVCKILCLIEVLTKIFDTDGICVRSIRETLTRGASTLFDSLRIRYVTLVVYPRGRDHDLELSLQKVNAELRSILGPSTRSQNPSEHMTQSNFDKKELLLESLDKQKLARFFSDGILFASEGAYLRAALISDRQQGSVENHFQKLDSSFRIKYLYNNELCPHLRKEVDQDTRLALDKFEKITADGDAARGKIALWKTWVSIMYVFIILILTMLAWAFNWKGADSVWERVFGGFEFATFALVGVFGLLKLAGEDPNMIRNTFLGFIRLRTEDDVCWYAGTRNLPLALALYPKSAHWVNGFYTCYALYRTYGGISILTGLDMKSARMAGIYPISESVAVDLRTGRLRSIESNVGTERNVFRLGRSILPGTNVVNATNPLTKGIFRGPS